MDIFNAWVAKNGKTTKVKLDGSYNLTTAQIKWLRKQWAKEQRAMAKGRKGKRGWTGFRTEKIATVLTLQEKAWAEAGKMVGIMESGGNNRGKQVEQIIREGGGVAGSAWCGYAVAAAYKRAGSKVPSWKWGAVRWLGTLTGQKFTSDPVKGDIVTFTFDHTGLFGWWSDSRGNKVPRSKATHIFTREGNTGATGSVSDSKDGRDGMREKLRPISQIARFVRVLR